MSHLNKKVSKSLKTLTTEKEITYGGFKLYAKNDDNLEGLLSTLKRFSDNIRKQSGREKCAKVTFKKGSLVKSKNISLDINTDITGLEHNKIYEYLKINEVNGINHTINKEK